MSGSALPAGGAARPRGGNLRARPDRYQRGDVDKGFAEADVVLEQTYRTECEIHTPLELHGCVAKWDGDRLTVWESTQGVYAVQIQGRRGPGAPPVARCASSATTWGEDSAASSQAGKVHRHRGAPGEEDRTSGETLPDPGRDLPRRGKPPPGNMTAEGRGEKGRDVDRARCSAASPRAAPTRPGDRAGGLARSRPLPLPQRPHGPSRMSIINAGPSRPFRAPGHPQGAWALEQMMDALAEAIRMDPVELRLKNIPSFSQAREGNPPYTTTGLQGVPARRGPSAFGWEKAAGKPARQSATGQHAKGGRHGRRHVGRGRRRTRRRPSSSSSSPTAAST